MDSRGADKDFLPAAAAAVVATAASASAPAPATDGLLSRSGQRSAESQRSATRNRNSTRSSSGYLLSLQFSVVRRRGEFDRFESFQIGNENSAHMTFDAPLAAARLARRAVVFETHEAFTIA